MTESINTVIDDYLETCKLYGKKNLTREEYRSDGHYSTTLIEQHWGSWTNFTNYVDKCKYLGRQQTVKHTSSNKVVITSAFDGSSINYDCLKTLENYCKKEKADLFILWGKPVTKNAIFNEKDYYKLIKHLCTELVLDKDPNYNIRDVLITATQVNPLTNVDKFSNGKDNIILGAAKQYMKTLPYKRLDQKHFAYTTGTISNIDYGERINDKLNAKYHTYGAIVLEYDHNTKSYDARNLVYLNSKMYDQDKWYTTTKSGSVKSVKAIILGDLHFPADDIIAVKKSKEMIKKLHPETVVLHDVGDFLSINHHNEHQYLSRQMFMTTVTSSLRTELNFILQKLKDLTKEFKNTTFYIASSNHDDFIKKWLDTGEYPKDRVNAEIGHELYMLYLKGGNVFDMACCDNIKKATRDDNLNICGYNVLEHGDGGLGGGRGSTTTYTKMFDRAVVGHTHSPEIYQSTIHVGTLSRLNMVYNDKGGTTWAHANVVIYDNGAFQMVFV